MDLVNTMPELNDIKLIIFDCDGVLIDSEGLSKRELLALLKTLGVNITDDYFEAHFLGHSFEHVTAKIYQDFGVALPDTFRPEYQKALIAAFTAELQPTLGLKDLLDSLAVPRCIATSSSPTRVGHAMKVTGLDQYFAPHIFTASQVKNGKPAPDLFLHAAKNMGVDAKHCLVIEDSPAGVQGAKAANMQVIRYAGASHMEPWRRAIDPLTDDVTTISQWQDLYALAPELTTTY
ncbi:MAG: HAD family hydrolase [Paraglaciecola chathamensis]